LGWLWVSICGIGVLFVSLLHNAPWWLSLLRAAGVMLILGFLVWTLSDNLVRGLLESQVASASKFPDSSASSHSTHDLNA
ncbi:MAG: hypothetical protein N3A60_00695, partial [Thermanaerothrix sp.]|nr:hypothetical protein [Thermanaerothrix sp.]